MSTNEDKARRLDWRIYKTSAELDAALEESGGEVTPEIEAIEARLAEDADALGELGAAMTRDAKAQQGVAKAEEKRVREARAFQERRESYGRRLVRLALEAKGERKARFGTFGAHMAKGRERAVVVDEFSPEELRDRGLGRFETTFKPDAKAIAFELKSGGEVKGYALERGPETVVVK